MNDLKQIRGRVIRPDDADYDEARTIFYGGFDYHPRAIVRPADVDDVARVVTVAAETGSELAVRSGGHSLAGHSTTEGGIVLDLHDMRALDIDLASRTAWAQTGLTTGEYTTAAGEHGLATGFGDTGSVGIGGITLAGGLGFLIRKHGLTIDNVLAAEVVTADGRILHADEETNPDLFWAIRGGGGNFGVVTRLQFRLHEVAEIVGGMMILPASPEVVAGFVAEADAAPAELSTIANVMVAPPMPFLPPGVHGKLVMMGLMAFAGDIAEGEKAVSRLRDLAEPLVDMVKPIRYPELFFEPEGAEEFHPTAASKTFFLDQFDESDAKAVISQIEGSTAMMSAVQLRVLGGAYARVASDATAFAHRQRKMMANVAAMFMDPTEHSGHAAWVDGVADSLQGDDNDGYVGFITDEGEDGRAGPTRMTTWSRLREVKGRYDPTNLFRLNQNIPPA